VVKKAIRILIVDDELEVVKPIRLYLVQQGFEVFTAATAEDGLERLAVGDIDVGIIDNMLPGVSGPELIRKAHDSGSTTKFLMFTGTVDFPVPDILKEINFSSMQVLFKPLPSLKFAVEVIESLIAGKLQAG